MTDYKPLDIKVYKEKLERSALGGAVMISKITVIALSAKNVKIAAGRFSLRMQKL